MSQTPAPDPLIGQVVEGRYRVLGELGRGGMGTIYRVEHVMMKKEMALKILRPELGGSEELVRRFQREAEAAARLSHANIVAVIDFGRTSEGQLFLVMELLDGVSLTSVIANSQPLGVDRAVNIIRQILRALQHAHLAGVVHRDLKPDNIVLVEQDGVRDIVKLIDLGIAKLSAGEGERGEPLTQAGMIYGTPEYLSPEQALGEPVDARADLYSAGVILYEMLSGRRPFEADSKLALVSMHITARAIPVVKAAPEAAIPASLSAVVERAMQKRREDRFPDAVSFLGALDPQGSAGHRGRSVTLSARVSRTVRGTLGGIEDFLAMRGYSNVKLLARVGIVCALVLAAGGAFALLRRPMSTPAAVLAAPSAALDAERQLKSAHTCKDRKAAALELIATGERRYLGAIEAARDRRGGFLGLERMNGCMQKELELGVRKLQGAP